MPYGIMNGMTRVILPKPARKSSMFKKRLPQGFDVMQAVRDDREERIRKLAGVAPADFAAKITQP